MPKTAPPVNLSPNSWKSYYNSLNRHILTPLLFSTRQTVSKAGSDYVRIREAIQNIPSDPRMASLSGSAATVQFQKIKNQHKKEFERSMRKHLGVAFKVQDTPNIKNKLDQFVDENVRLIKTIPPRFHSAIISDLTKLIDSNSAFDEQKLSKIINQKYGSSGYNLKRITRDQTTKAVGNLNNIRQTDAGIKQYKWSTSEDGRVRSNHQSLNGRIFDWNKPPTGGGTTPFEAGHPGHGILCRCVALAVIPSVTKKPKVTRSKPEDVEKVVMSKMGELKTMRAELAKAKDPETSDQLVKKIKESEEALRGEIKNYYNSVSRGKNKYSYESDLEWGDFDKHRIMVNEWRDNPPPNFVNQLDNDTLRDYTTTGYNSMNREYRNLVAGKIDKISDETKQKVDEIVRLGGEIGKDTTLYRGINQVLDYDEGGQIRYSGLQSTSSSPRTSLFFAEKDSNEYKTMIEIRAGSKSKATLTNVGEMEHIFMNPKLKVIEKRERVKVFDEKFISGISEPKNIERFYLMELIDE